MWSRRRLVDYVSRLASGLEVSEPPLAPHVSLAARLVGEELKGDIGGGVYVCRLCSRGPFTRKGYYLHLVRLHFQEILHRVLEESERIASLSRDVEF